MKSAIRTILAQERAAKLEAAGTAVLVAVDIRADTITKMLRGEIPIRSAPLESRDEFWDWLLEVPPDWMGRPPQEDRRIYLAAVRREMR